ncbi:hypothetical protein BROUX41_001347 [Berkeleyomyces rouxiae]|uniref:uncharacterized protein n=1 Tax=Berkeleyomyces rouxiae TaxID=2035830 RepID=UPI003B8205CF
MYFWKPKKTPAPPQEPKRLVLHAPASLLLRGIISNKRRRSPSPETDGSAPASTSAPLPASAHTAAGSNSVINAYLHPDAATAPAPSADLVRRIAPDVIRCNSCHSDLAYQQLVVSWGFHGRYGRCMLVAPPNQAGVGSEESLENLVIGRIQERELTTGWHKVADINCLGCNRYVGWRYLDAAQEQALYKIGKYCIEEGRTYVHSPWELTRSEEDWYVSGSIANIDSNYGANIVSQTA